MTAAGTGDRARQGLGQLTHRRVAAEADVPVGSTTYYFSDLAALREAALAHAATTSADHLEQWRRELDEEPRLARRLARLTASIWPTPSRHRTLNELYLAAGHRAELQPLARLWPEGLVAFLEPRIGDRPPTPSPCSSTVPCCTRLSPARRWASMR